MCSDTELLELFPGLPTDFRTKNIFRVVDGRSLFYLYVTLVHGSVVSQSSTLAKDTSPQR